MLQLSVFRIHSDKFPRKKIDQSKKLIRLVFSRFFDICGNLGNAKEKPTRKTCFLREMKRLALHIYLAKFCWAVFL